MRRRSEWAPVAGLVPHDWEGPARASAGTPTYAVAGAEQSFLSVDEKMDKEAAAAALPTFVTYVPRHCPSQQRRRPPTYALFTPRRFTSPPARLSKLDVQVEVIEMKESPSAVPGDTTPHRGSPRSPRASSDPWWASRASRPGQKFRQSETRPVLRLNPFWHCVSRS